jgi:hemolysin activation/secretion protein
MKRCCALAIGLVLAGVAGAPLYLTQPAEADSAPMPPTTMPIDDGPTYDVSNLDIQYTQIAAGGITINDILNQDVVLGWIPSGYCDAYTTNALGARVIRADVQIVRTKFSRLSQMTARSFHASALRSISEQIVNYLNSSGVMGVYADVSAQDINGTQDLRPPGDTTLRIDIHTAVVTILRTVVSGDRFANQTQKINNPMVAKIATYSPIQPANTAGPGTTDVLESQVLNSYVDQLNRQPGRQVAVSISQDKTSTWPDAVDLDYLVHEDKPWRAYFQLSNTGTPQTNIWREQFGFIDNQLLGFDDQFNINYTTAGFTEQNDVNASYNFPLDPLGRLRMHVYGGYNSFSASDIGFGNAQFNGDETTLGGEAILNVFQHNRFFLDLIAGGRYQHIFVDNTLLGQTGDADFGIPYVGVHADHYTPTDQFSLDASVLYYWSGASQAQLNNLGREMPSTNPVVLQGDGLYQFYLEPLLDPSGFQAGTSTLANEIRLSVSGQEAFGSRLIAEDEMAVGGLDTVRGYPQSATAGDSVGVESVEYRLHIPHLFPVQPTPGTLFGQTFRYSPQEAYGPTDWDLIAKAFVDAGEVYNSDQQSYEVNSTLVGTGLGIELDLKQNMSLLADWGVALTPINAASSTGTAVSAGSSQFNLSFTVSY